MVGPGQLLATVPTMHVTLTPGRIHQIQRVVLAEAVDQVALERMLSSYRQGEAVAILYQGDMSIKAGQTIIPEVTAVLLNSDAATT